MILEEATVRQGPKYKAPQDKANQLRIWYLSVIAAGKMMKHMHVPRSHTPYACLQFTEDKNNKNINHS